MALDLFQFLSQAAAFGLPIGGAMAGGAAEGMGRRASLDQTYADIEMRRNADRRAQEAHPLDMDRVRQIIQLNREQGYREGEDFAEGSRTLAETGAAGNVAENYTGVEPGMNVRSFRRMGGGIMADKFMKTKGAIGGGTAEFNLEAGLWKQYSTLAQQLKVEDPKLAVLMEQKGFEVLRESRQPTAQALYNVTKRLQELRGGGMVELPQGTNPTGAQPLPTTAPAAKPAPAPAKGAAPKPVPAAAPMVPKSKADYERMKAENPDAILQWLKSGGNPAQLP